MQIYIGYINVHTHLTILRSVLFPLKLSFKSPVKESDFLKRKSLRMYQKTRQKFLILIIAV